jgi:hypothetical protein
MRHYVVSSKQKGQCGGQPPPKGSSRVPNVALNQTGFLPAPFWEWRGEHLLPHQRTSPLSEQRTQG